jgi:SAM-dependent methyltransferase
MDDRKQYWETIYQTKSPDRLSWTQSKCFPSIEWIEQEAPKKNSAIIDVGAGISKLSSCLLESGYNDISVIDISESALKATQERMGARASSIHWLSADILNFDSKNRFDLWHDRALFHFFNSRSDREKYIRNAHTSLKPNGKLILATFSPNGPGQCSGLDVVRFDEKALAEEVGSLFIVLRAERHLHQTPWGSEQEFVYSAFQKIG